jgi:hypothetical protein
MSSINPKKRKAPVKKVLNEEGYEVYQKKDDLALFEVMNSFVFKGGVYHTEKEKLAMLEDLIDKNLKTDRDYVLALSYFLSFDLGIKLSPVLAVTRTVLNEKDLSDKNKEEIKKLVLSIYNRPDKISNSLAYAKNIYGRKSIGDVPAFFKRALKKALEGFSELTLKKFKMKGKDVTLSDLIKVLHPTPKNNKMSEFYKGIIENTGKVVALKKEEHITATLSDNTITQEEKKEIIDNNVEKMPINALIRNLKQFNDSDNGTIYEVISKRINEVLKAKNAVAIVNPFDLVFVSCDKSGGMFGREKSEFSFGGVNKKLLDVVDNALHDKFIKKFNFEDKNVAFLIDVSGSMSGENIVKAMKFYSIFYPMYKKAKVFFYNTSLVDVPGFTEMSEKFKGFPNFLAMGGLDKLNGKVQGGTSTHECAERILRDNDVNSLIIITDEVTHNDDRDVDYYNKELNKLCKSGDLKVILVNIAPTEKTAFNLNKNLMRVSGLNPKIFNFLNMLYDFNKFKKEIKDKYYQLVSGTKDTNYLKE